MNNAITVDTPYVLILFYSRGGATALMAETMAQGIEKVNGICAKLRTVHSLSGDDVSGAQPQHPICSKDDLANCAGLILGSPTRFGNMAAPLKSFLDQTSDLWLNGDLIDKPASAFTSTGSLHGGQETTLMTMLLPLMHHGMIISGIPYSESALHHTHSGGTPYGASHTNHSQAFDEPELTEHETTLCLAQGERMAHLARKLL